MAIDLSELEVEIRALRKRLEQLEGQLAEAQSQSRELGTPRLRGMYGRWEGTSVDEDLIEACAVKLDLEWLKAS
jgi:hypothetical protein